MARFRRRRTRLPGIASDAFVLAAVAAVGMAAFEIDPEGAANQVKQGLAQVSGAIGESAAPVPEAALTKAGDWPLPEKGQDRVAAVEPQPMPSRKRVELFPPYEIVDASTFVSGEWTIVLDGVEGPLREAVCYDGSGLLYGCGLRARAALNNAIRRRQLSCELLLARGPNHASAECRADGRDIALELLSGGWLRPLAPTNAERETARGRAEAAGAGLWDGGWRIR